MGNLIEDLSDARLKNVEKEQQPAWLRPMLATLTSDYFSDKDWIYERKFDGERCLCFKNGDRARLLSRNKKLINDNYPEIAEALQGAGHDFIIDGEIVAFRGSVTSFAMLQNRIQLHDPEKARNSGVDVYYYIFDILHLGGYNLRNLELSLRKELLKQMLEFKDPIRYTTHRNEEGEKFLEEACREGWEGIIAKKKDSSYVAGRSRSWLKFKCVKEQEFVIGGYTEPHGARTGFGALLVGYYEGDRLTYAGKVGTGYDDDTLKKLGGRLARLEQNASPFTGEVKEKGVHWVKPELVAQIAFTEWTPYGKLRQPRFLGLRRDKEPGEVIREG